MSEQKSLGKPTDVKDDVQTGTNVLNPILNEKFPSSNVNLRFLFINGRKFDLLVLPTDTIETIRKAALQAWPKGRNYCFFPSTLEYADEMPSNHSSIKFLFRGRYLENETITRNLYNYIA
jgi:hypothetical protein